MQIVKNRFIFIGISLILIIGGIASMVINSVRGNGAFNLDIQFTGGVSIQANVGNDVTADDINSLVEETVGAKPSQTQMVPIDDSQSVILKFKELTNENTSALQDKMIEAYGITEEDFTVQNVSATISSEMLRDSILSVVVACIAMLIYVSIRFKDVKKGSSAIIALCHDALIVLGSYALFRIPLNNNFIAAILTVLGYSINATIVIFDRVRENTRSVGRKNYEELVNLSVKQTMSRSIFTSLTTFITVAALYVFGVDSIRQFALPIAVGIICGTYSSICVAGNVWYLLSTKIGKKKK
ncbi:MAG: protein translocase subunit SecF [Lachnospirales bacterium]